MINQTIEISKLCSKTKRDDEPERTSELPLSSWYSTFAKSHHRKLHAASNFTLPSFRLDFVRGNRFVGAISCSITASGATTEARCRALRVNELFCFAFKRALPDVIQLDMVVAITLLKGFALMIPV